MLINELAKRSGLSPHTIRFYEKSGLIKGTRKEHVTTNNYLHYDEQTVEKLELIRDAKSVGFTIREISTLMDAWYNNKMSQGKKIQVIDAKLKSIDERIIQLKQMKKMLKDFRKDVQAERC